MVSLILGPGPDIRATYKALLRHGRTQDRHGKVRRIYPGILSWRGRDGLKSLLPDFTLALHGIRFEEDLGSGCYVFYPVGAKEAAREVGVIVRKGA